MILWADWSLVDCTISLWVDNAHEIDIQEVQWFTHMHDKCSLPHTPAGFNVYFKLLISTPLKENNPWCLEFKLYISLKICQLMILQLKLFYYHRLFYIKSEAEMLLFLKICRVEPEWSFHVWWFSGVLSCIACMHWFSSLPGSMYRSSSIIAIDDT